MRTYHKIFFCFFFTLLFFMIVAQWNKVSILHQRFIISNSDVNLQVLIGKGNYRALNNIWGFCYLESLGGSYRDLQIKFSQQKTRLTRVQIKDSKLGVIVFDKNALQIKDGLLAVYNSKANSYDLKVTVPICDLQLLLEYYIFENGVDIKKSVIIPLKYEESLETKFSKLSDIIGSA